MKTIVTVKDPVCGMDVDPANAVGQAKYKGQDFYFCGSTCKEKFEDNPQQYVGKDIATSKPGGCCS